MPMVPKCFLKRKFFPFQNIKNYLNRLRIRKVRCNWNFCKMRRLDKEKKVTKNLRKVKRNRSMNLSNFKVIVLYVPSTDSSDFWRENRAFCIFFENNIHFGLLYATSTPKLILPSPDYSFVFDIILTVLLYNHVWITFFQVN